LCFGVLKFIAIEDDAGLSKPFLHKQWKCIAERFAYRVEVTYEENFPGPLEITI
jgi:hypothetical protein